MTAGLPVAETGNINAYGWIHSWLVIQSEAKDLFAARTILWDCHGTRQRGLPSSRDP